MARILVVDDVPEIRNLVQQILGRAGHEIMLAENGAVALALCQQAQPDVVVTDMLMGEMNGIDLIRALGREHPGLRAIAMSGASQSVDYYLSVSQADRRAQDPQETVFARGTARRGRRGVEPGACATVVHEQKKPYRLSDL